MDATNDGRTADVEHEGVGGLVGQGPSGTAGTDSETQSITCRECGDEDVRAVHGERVVITCPSCREIRYRSGGRIEPAL